MGYDKRIHAMLFLGRDVHRLIKLLAALSHYSMRDVVEESVMLYVEKYGYEDALNMMEDRL